MNKWIRKYIYCVEKDDKRRQAQKNFWLVLAAFLKHHISLVDDGMRKDDAQKRREISSTLEYSRVLAHLDERVHENDLEKRWRDMTCMWAIVIVIVVRYAAQTLNAPKNVFFVLCCFAYVAVSLRLYFPIFSHVRVFGRVLRFFFFIFVMLNVRCSFVPWMQHTRRPLRSFSYVSLRMQFALDDDDEQWTFLSPANVLTLFILVVVSKQSLFTYKRMQKCVVCTVHGNVRNQFRKRA